MITNNNKVTYITPKSLETKLRCALRQNGWSIRESINNIPVVNKCAKDLSMDIVKEIITILQSTGHVRSYNSFFCSKKNEIQTNTSQITSRQCHLSC